MKRTATLRDIYDAEWELQIALNHGDEQAIEMCELELQELIDLYYDALPTPNSFRALEQDDERLRHGINPSLLID